MLALSENILLGAVFLVVLLLGGVVVEIWRNEP